MKTFLSITTLLLILIVGFYLFNGHKEPNIVKDYKNTTYQIDGKMVTLVNGVSETAIVPDSASKIITRYFGNDFKTDLNNDGREDIVFILTQELGGSGVFFYAVSALNTEKGYVGSDGYLLGDRIAPQNIGASTNPRHKNVLMVDYKDRAQNDPMTTAPHISKSVYLKLNTINMKWGIVEPNFEGESR
ncbi:MAG: hypothetical protein WC059_04005 [Candidatus Paceibacterota bacterium]